MKIEAGLIDLFGSRIKTLSVNIIYSMKKTALLFSCAILSACSTQKYWVKPGASDNDFAKDRYSCLQESQQRVGASSFNAYGGGSVSKVVTNDQLFSACMSAKGWNIQEKNESTGSKGSQKFSLPNTSSTVDNSINLSAAGNEAIQFVHIRRQEVCASEEFATITKKSPCDPRDIGDQIFNKSKPTQQEIQLERKLQSQLQDLFNQEITAYKTDSGMGAERRSTLLTIYNGREQRVFEQFYSGSMTWGELNNQRSKISIEKRRSL